MKAFLFSVLFLAAVQGRPPKLKFRYIDLKTPIYISQADINNISGDSVLWLLKDTLSNLKGSIISQEAYNRLRQRYFDDIRASTVEIMSSFDERGAASSRERMKNVYASGTPSQKVTIQYSSLTNNQTTLETCDSIGFTYFALPMKTPSQKQIRLMWNIKEVGSKSVDSIALFLLKKL